MRKKIFFTIFPPHPYFTYPFHIRQSSKSLFLSMVPSASMVAEISESFIRHLTKLLVIPEHYRAVLFNSEYEFQSFLCDVFFHSKSVSLVHGPKGREFVNLLKYRKCHPATILFHPGLKTEKIKPFNQILPAHIFMNEPDAGTCVGTDTLKQVFQVKENVFVHTDLSDCLPGVPFDFHLVPSFSFGFNTSFGIPFNEIIWFAAESIFNDFLFAFEGRHPASNLELLTGNFYSFGIPDLLFMDVAAKVLADLDSRGIKNIINETKYKAAIIEHAVSGNPVFSQTIKESQNRSLTTIVLNYQGESQNAAGYLEKHGIITDQLVSKDSLQKLRIANFPVHSKEQFELLADLIKILN